MRLGQINGNAARCPGPEEVICRRYEKGWRNFNTVYKAIVDSWVLYDNSGDQPVLLDTGGHR